jgi:hypothetical protein
MPKTREQKRDEALQRRNIAKKRTPEEQLALLEDRPGNAKWERLKLAAEIAVRQREDR